MKTTSYDIQKLTAKEYSSLEAPVLFSEEDRRFNKCFGIITIGEQRYKFSWYSDLVEPIIELLDSNLFGIGIDQHFCILNSSNGIYKCWDLDTPFLYMIVYEGYVVVICEINILFISLDALKIEKDYLFSEIISDVKLKNRIMRTVFIDDNELDIPIDDNNNPHLTLKTK
jgi:hypothetical protein